MEVYPYEIVHLDINDDTAVLDAVNTTRNGFYFVFWKNCIPVGDLWVEKGAAPAPGDLLKKMKEKITAALDQYAAPALERFMHPAVTEGCTADVSVIICTRNRTEDLNKCLSALQQQLCTPREIIVVDNAPLDDATMLLTQNFPEVRYVREPRPGLDIARNTGAKNANSPILAYTDDDVIPHRLWLYHLKESFVNPDVMAMTGLIIAAELDTESQQIFEKHWSFNRGYLDKQYDMDYYAARLNNGPPVWEIGAGANMAFRKAVFERLGYFDERLDVGAAGCNGDSEMWFRILAANGIIHYNPRAVTFHHHRRHIKQLKRQIFYYMRGFAAAALIQQKTDRRLGYRKHLLRRIPKSYLRRVIKGFPDYADFHRTLFDEIRGVISGIIYYQRHKRMKR